MEGRCGVATVLNNLGHTENGCPLFKLTGRAGWGGNTRDATHERNKKLTSGASGRGQETDGALENFGREHIPRPFQDLDALYVPGEYHGKPFLRLLETKRIDGYG